MTNRIYPSIAMLPVEDLANYLSIVHGFRSKDELSPDVERVDGVSSEKIAIAATDSYGNLISGRNTVENALNLGGISADNFLTIENSKTLLVDAHTISRINADEIKNLRDELYQMKSELVKNGLVSDTYSYHGFQDPFRAGNIKYIDEAITRTATVENRATISDITVVDASDIFVGEYIVVEDAGKHFLTKVIKKEENRLFISPSIDGPLSSVALVKRSLGMYHNASFLFGEEHGQLITDKEKHIILNDDFGDGESSTGRALPRMNKNNYGFATHFKVPTSVVGAITKLTVAVRGAGRPGLLKCYIADPDTSDGKDIFEMATIQEMKDAGKILCESDGINSSVLTTSFVDREFVFPQPAKLSNKRYVAIIKTLEADEHNYWELRGLIRYGGGDLHTNIDLYQVREGHSSLAISKEKLEDDLYFAITTNEVNENTISYLQQGLYSTKVEIPQGQDVTRIRVELKVNREGKYKVVDNPSSLVIKAGDILTIENEDKKSYASSIFSSETCNNVVIGNQVSQIGSYRISNTAFSLVDDVYAPPGAQVYRIGYNVIVTAKNKTIDYKKPNNPIEYKDSKVIPLTLTAVIPGKEAGKENSSSDRLIFEGEFGIQDGSDYKLKGYNDLLVQVAWTSSGSTAAEMYSNPELAGSIYDISISTDKAYNKDTNALVAKFEQEMRHVQDEA